MLASVDEEERYRSLLDAKIEEGVIKPTSHYKKSTSAAAKVKRKREADREKKEAEELSRELGLDNADLSTEASLTALIQRKNQANSDAWLAHLEAKYTSTKKKTKKR